MQKNKATDTSWVMPAIGAMLFWGLWAFLPKLVLDEVTPYSFLFLEAVTWFCVAIGILVHLRGRLQTDMRGVRITILSNFIGMGSLFCYLYALSQGPATVILTLTGLYPMISIFLAWALLKEKINKWQVLAIGLAMESIWLLST